MSSSIPTRAKKPKSIRWIPDDEAPSCMSCVKEFNLSRRRHHCRLCGHVVCGACSSHKVSVPGRDGMIRVCDDCYVSFDTNGKTGPNVGTGGTLNGQSSSPSAPAPTPAAVLLGPTSTTSISEESFGTFQTTEDAVIEANPANAHRNLYESPMLAENPNKCCCVIL